jgi:hypothetical protein
MSIFVASLLSGCVSPPTADEVAKLDYGSYPADYKQSIERYLNVVLKDPDSKKIEWLREPLTMYHKASPMLGGQLIAGYAVCAYVNGRNSYGGYTGSKLSWFLIKNDKVIQSFMSTSRDSIETKQAEQSCQVLK